MQNEKIHIERIKRFLARINPLIYPDRIDLQAKYIYNQENPISYDQRGEYAYKPITKGEIWGHTWGSGWFQFSVTVPPELAGKAIGAWIDLDGEGCVWKDASPWMGLTSKVDWYHNAGKYFIPLSEYAQAGENYELLVEAAANDLFGGGKQDYILKEAALVSLDQDLQQICLSFGLLLNLMEALPDKTVRRQRILFGLNRVCNLWQDGKGKDEILAVLADLLNQPAHASALTAISIGHAHIDLAWLWPIRETKRKGGRTFSTALRLLNTYPEYKFGASQAQLYKWMQEMYPALYAEIKAAVNQKRWEVQGAGWVEFDTNLNSGESIIRQLLYGRRYFQQEFGIKPDVLWLPDCFGFSGNLPQLMQGCGVKYFMTQKLSWNETNTFPHHLFEWCGIDGSKVLAHQLPTNDYNFSNNPAAFLETEKRFAQSDVCDSFLNLFGIGDGGGGPSKEHIEYGIRQQNLEGVSKFKFAFAQEFFEQTEDIDKALLPKWFGELYLEFHRGTYTTQALMKKHNRISEQLLHTCEFLAAIQGKVYPAELTKIWEDTLLMQFHDIIPGSSIGWVYKDVARMSEQNHAALRALIIKQMDEMNDAKDIESKSIAAYKIFNDQSWERTEWVKLHDQPLNNWALVTVPAYGYQIIEDNPRQNEELLPFANILENEFLCIKLEEDGSIVSIYDKEHLRSALAAPSNLLQLWEDEPNNWGAWDINHYYRETIPQSPSNVRLLGEESFVIPGSIVRAVFELTIGKSMVRQIIELYAGERLIRISHEVDWKEHHKMLRVQFTPNIYAEQATYEIQMGVIKRPVKQNYSWQQVQFEVPAHRFADLSQPDYGVALLNDSKYGYRIVENCMELNLLRSPADVDPEADLHFHTYRYAFYPHTGDFEHSDVLKIAHCFNSPLLVQPLSRFPAQRSYSYCHLESDTVKLETIKPAERGDGFILRMYEFAGKNTSANLIINLPFTELFGCDLTEQNLIPWSAQPDAVHPAHEGYMLSFRPFEIKTLYLK